MISMAVRTRLNITVSLSVIKIKSKYVLILSKVVQDGSALRKTSLGMERVGGRRHKTTQVSAAHVRDRNFT